ncbi:ATP-binding protein [Pseudoramibacter sp.]|jgi:ethanolamine utilization cobalamin adenosyltransferase|uniref:ATP-binding protein n=1 Tax=Pseudoramibacter sp. TaxID=2034862 RepID=UPI0025F05D77|nr:ATP-binding protein [Pseudoramibacter sp.]MCH4071389.1 ATP-binding protein [Pseudoramibacter sp.]MCH4105157.1 ATP-binding protein [Pseudoramibacter sp.]
MKVITERTLREAEAGGTKVFVMEKGQILSPAAREYLTDHHMRVEQRQDANQREKLPGAKHKSPLQEAPLAAVKEKKVSNKPQPKLPERCYIDHETGAFYTQKPEYMTQLFGKTLVMKNHPRIVFRGKLDDVQATVVLIQAQLEGENGSKALISDLTDILVTLRLMMRAEVLDEAFEKETILGLNHEQLREHSHYPMKYYNIKQMVLPDKSLGVTYARLNKLRTEIRETELIAISAYKEGRNISHEDIIEGLNRLSSALHIMMCRYLAHDYDH